MAWATHDLGNLVGKSLAVRDDALEHSTTDNLAKGGLCEAIVRNSLV